MTIEERERGAGAWRRSYRFDIPPFPNGWFQVAYSDELDTGDVLPLEYFGKHLVLFRDDDGMAHVLDAFCPHLGAHLGYGGRVEDNCIRCPFHAWRFDGGGQCVEVPYANKIPPLAKLDAWHVCEVNGLIMVWHHIGGAAAAVGAADDHGIRHERRGRTTRAGAGRSGRTTRRWPRTPSTRRTSSTCTARRSSRDARRDRRPHLQREVAGELHDAAGHGRGRHRVRRTTASASATVRFTGHRRDAARVVGDADRRRVRGRALLVHGEEARQRRRDGGRRQGVHRRDRAAARAGHPDLGAQGDEDAAGALRRRRPDRHLPPLGEAVLQRRADAGSSPRTARARARRCRAPSTHSST